MAGGIGTLLLFASGILVSSVMVSSTVPAGGISELQSDGTLATSTSRGSNVSRQSPSAPTDGSPVPSSTSRSVLQLSRWWNKPHADRSSSSTTSTASSTSSSGTSRRALRLDTRSYSPALSNLTASSSTRRRSVVCSCTVTFSLLSGPEGSGSQEQLSWIFH